MIFEITNGYDTNNTIKNAKCIININLQKIPMVNIDQIMVNNKAVAFVAKKKKKIKNTYLHRADQDWKDKTH